jgi:MATE family multidrug resistance protein
MRNTMLIAAFAMFFPVWAITNFIPAFATLGNHSLWLALSCFMAARGLGQWLWLRKSSYMQAQL